MSIERHSEHQTNTSEFPLPISSCTYPLSPSKVYTGAPAPPRDLPDVLQLAVGMFHSTTQQLHSRIPDVIAPKLQALQVGVILQSTDHVFTGLSREKAAGYPAEREMSWNHDSLSQRFSEHEVVNVLEPPS